MEESSVALKTTLDHMSVDIAEMKVDIRRLNDKVDAVDQRLASKIDEVDKRLCGKIDEVDKRLNGKIDALKDVVAALALSMERSFGELRAARWMDRVWWLLIAAALLGVMAKGFKWI